MNNCISGSISGSRSRSRGDFSSRSEGLGLGSGSGVGLGVGSFDAVSVSYEASDSTGTGTDGGSVIELLISARTNTEGHTQGQGQGQAEAEQSSSHYHVRPKLSFVEKIGSVKFNVCGSDERDREGEEARCRESSEKIRNRSPSPYGHSERTNSTADGERDSREEVVREQSHRNIARNSAERSLPSSTGTSRECSARSSGGDEQCLSVADSSGLSAHPSLYLPSPRQQTPPRLSPLPLNEHTDTGSTAGPIPSQPATVTHTHTHPYSNRSFVQHTHSSAQSNLKGPTVSPRLRALPLCPQPPRQSAGSIPDMLRDRRKRSTAAYALVDPIPAPGSHCRIPSGPPISRGTGARAGQGVSHLQVPALGGDRKDFGRDTDAQHTLPIRSSRVSDIRKELRRAGGVGGGVGGNDPQKSVGSSSSQLLLSCKQHVPAPLLSEKREREPIASVRQSLSLAQKQGRERDQKARLLGPKPTPRIIPNMRPLKSTETEIKTVKTVLPTLSNGKNQNWSDQVHSKPQQQQQQQQQMLSVEERKRRFDEGEEREREKGSGCFDKVKGEMSDFYLDEWFHANPLKPPDMYGDEGEGGEEEGEGESYSDNDDGRVDTGSAIPSSVEWKGKEKHGPIRAHSIDLSAEGERGEDSTDHIMDSGKEKEKDSQKDSQKDKDKEKWKGRKEEKIGNGLSESDMGLDREEGDRWY
jgi:hypothetical protein